MKAFLRSQMVLAMACLFVVSCGRDKEQGASPVQAPALSSVADIAAAPDRRELVGRSVDITDAHVRGVVGNFFFWVGDERSQIPVVRLDKLRGPVTQHVRQNNSVALVGTVQLTSNIGADDRLWELVNEKERREIEAANVYVGAESVTVR